MGSTIRRQPITRDVPKAPDYKFLNLTSFGGLNMTDNPFTAPYNTASDCKNVYVDEFNALTTRPRLEKKYDISAKLPDGSEIIDVHNLVNGYLIHYKINDTYEMKMLLNTGELKTIKGKIPTEKCTVFENGDIIYLLDGSSYKNIKDYVISDVEGYVPTTVIGKSNTLKGQNYEPLNLLSDIYKETYYWDGNYDLSEISDSNVLNIENNYINKKSINKTNSISSYDNILFVKKLEDNTSEQTRWLGHEYIGGPISIFNINKENNKITIDKRVYSAQTIMSTDSSDDGSVVVSVSQEWDDTTNANVNIVKVHTVTESEITSTTLRTSYPGSIAPIKISSDGSIIITSGAELNSNKSYLCIYKLNDSGEYVEIKNILTDTSIRNFVTSKDFNTIIYIVDNQGHHELNIIKDAFKTSEFPNEITSVTLATNGYINSAIYSDGSKYVYSQNNTIYYFYDILNSTDFETIQIPFYNHKFIEFSKNGEFLYIFNDGDKYETNHLYVNLKLKNSTILQFTDIPDNEDIEYQMTTGVQNNGDDSFYIFGALRLYSTSGFTYNVTKMFLDFYNSDPLITITKKVSPINEEYTSYSEKRKKFLNSKIITRFENNWWFASNNSVFYTVNNNPSYVSTTSYSDLGSENESITGFNVIQDNLLVAYKKNKLWIIQPIVIDDISTYSFLESKNTVGNTAFGSTIITSLTENPLQINYDGVYVLRQLENVQSSDRISTLISDAISKKWLKESKDAIDNAKTINRLYWTYIALKDENKTKIYLLDNRTTSWFYWELPINLLNIFVKDDTTHLVDTKGNIYILTTTDIPSEFVQGKLNYYDDGHKIIDWFWNSQILSLNTINYSKRLIDTTFILTDTDTQDNYSLDYKFKAYRKLVDETDYTTLQNDIKYVQSVTKKTLIPRFKFLQIELSNDKSDDWDDYNKVRLIGLGLKYVLLEVMR